MNLLKYTKWLIFLFPLAFLLLNFVYKDSTYIVLSIISLLVGLLLTFPRLISGNIALNTKRKVFSKDKKLSTKKEAKLLSKIITKGDVSYFSLVVSTVVFIAFFTYIAAYVMPTVPQVHNLIQEYYVSQLVSLKTSWIYIVLLVIVVSFVGSSLEFDRKEKELSYQFNRKLLRKTFLFSLLSIVPAVILSIVTVYLFAVIQLNSAVIAIKTTPGIVGVLYGKTAINNKLKSMTVLPQIIGSDANTSRTVLSTIIIGSAHPNSFYQTRVVKSIPQFLIIPFSINNQSAVMVNNTLIITSIDKDTMQTLSPTIAKLLLKNYFKDRNLKGDPTITILNRQEYLAFRQDEINQEESKIQTLIQKVNNLLSSYQSDAYSTRQKINNDQSIVDNAASQESSAYNNCMNYGYTDFFTGQFIPYYTQSYCSSLQSQWAQVVAQGNQDISQLNGELQYDNEQITEAQNAVQAFQEYMQLVDEQKNSTPDELGLFEGPSHVRVVLDSTSPRGINDFLETLVHENLHYQSYVTQDRTFQFSDGSYDGFWEEGLTEYFARKVITADLGVSINQGYPLIVKVVAQIAKKIPESELQRIYFTKDEAGLEADLDGAYGSNFYKDSELYFETLSYLPAEQQVKTANNIMTRIGGKQLSTADLYSTDLQQE